MKIQLTTEQAQELLNYLSEKPWKETNGLINMIGKAYQEAQTVETKDSEK